MVERKITPEEMAGIIVSERKAEGFISEGYSELIVSDYVRGASANEIALKYFPRECEASLKVTTEAVRKVINICLPEEERKQIGLEHLVTAGKKGGAKAREEEKGIFGISSERMLEIRRKGGKVAGKKLYEEGLGLFKPGFVKAAVLSRGEVPFSDDEQQDFLDMCHDDDYLYLAGGNAGLINYEKIAEVLNERYHEGEEVRTKAKLTTYRGFMVESGKLKVSEEEKNRRATIASSNPGTLSVAEKNDCIALAKDPNYVHRSGSNKGAIDFKRISAWLNKKYHGGKDHRTNTGVCNFYRNYLRRMEKSEDL